MWTGIRVLSRCLIALALLSALGGCATDGNGGRESPDDPRRQWQQPGFTPFSA